MDYKIVVYKWFLLTLAVLLHMEHTVKAYLPFDDLALTPQPNTIIYINQARVPEANFPPSLPEDVK